MFILQLVLSFMIGMSTAKFCKKHEIGAFTGMAMCIALSLLLSVIFLKLGLT